MRTTKLNLGGTEYTLCFSARVVRDCTERYGDVNKVFDAMSEGEQYQQLDEVFWLLSRLMDAGARYDRRMGLNPPAPLTLDDLYDTLDINDLTGLQTAVVNSVISGQQQSVKARPKNSEATPGK